VKNEFTIKHYENRKQYATEKKMRTMKLHREYNKQYKMQKYELAINHHEYNKQMRIEMS